MNNKNFFIVVGILVIGGIAAFLSYMPERFDASGKIKMSDFPKAVGEWQSTDVPLSENDYKILETKNLIMRDYKNAKGDSVYLYIIYSENNRKVAHPPEICYSGGGSTIIEKSVLQLTNNIKANIFTIEDRDASQQLVVYWFKAADFSTYNYAKQQLKIALGHILGKKTSGAMIRISAKIKEGNKQAALGLIKSFADQIEPLVTKYVP